MNERIRELQSKSYLLCKQVVDDDGHIVVTPDKWFDKFAELIVRECCSKLEEMGEGWQEFAKNPPQGQAHNASEALFAAYRLKEDAVWELKEHFGVEE